MKLFSRNQKNSGYWDHIILPKKSWNKKGWIESYILELYYYRLLIKLLVKRDFVIFYKQTILGPLWYIIQPLISTLVFTVIFGKLAKISTDGIPPFLFYLAGTVVWSYFAVCVTTTSNTFTTNASVFGKVYFPRLTVPVANVIIGLVQFCLQFTIFLIFLFYYKNLGLKINLMLMNFPENILMEEGMLMQREACLKRILI